MVARPLVLLPGLLCDQVLWRHQIETLTQDDTISAMAERVLDQTRAPFASPGCRWAVMWRRKSCAKPLSARNV